MIETDVNAYHCEDCDVCIEDYDHHCVFFSKCIGGGNLMYFWGTLGGVLLNFMNIAIMLGCTAYIQGTLSKGAMGGSHHSNSSPIADQIKSAVLANGVI